jgi:hypothetical protein
MRRRLALLTVAALGGCTTPPPAPLAVMVHVRSDPGRPLAGVEVQYSGQTIAATDATGAAKLTLRGHEGEQFDVTVACPAGFQSPAQPLSIVLHRLADPTRMPEYEAACPPTTREVIVAVRADKGPELPVVYLGREIARTDASGAATVLLRVRPHEPFDLALSTADKASEQLRPQNPVATFTPRDQDEVFVFEPHFTVEPRKAVWHAPPPKGPVRIH